MLHPCNDHSFKNNSLIDADALKRSADHDNLPESFVIFITESDVLERGEPIYHIDRIIRETGEEFRDGAHIIYVNGENNDDTDLGRLMHDFKCKNAGDMYYNDLADMVRYFKINNRTGFFSTRNRSGRTGNVPQARHGIILHLKGLP